jgi:thiol-disulfide isomerase/thioredoxin
MKLRLALLLLPFACPILSAELSGPIPQAEIGALYQRAKSMPGDRNERIVLNSAIVEEGGKCLAAHPEAKPEDPSRDLLVRRVMLPAAERLYRDDPTAANREQLMELATEVASSGIYEGHLIEVEKPRAGMILARLEIYPNDDRQPVDAAKHIRAFIGQFPVRPDLKNSEALHGQALVYAAQLAAETNEPALGEELSRAIIDKYLAARGAVDTLISLGHPVPFEAELTTLDGNTIQFPKDTQGKVIVLDFWATWCGPCIASLPHVKEIHDKYRDRGVTVIGVSCDTPVGNETMESNKQKVAGMVSAKKLDWTQTWSGEWPACATRYGVTSIPTVFIIGRDGNIITTQGRGREEFFIQKAVGAPDAR